MFEVKTGLQDVVIATSTISAIGGQKGTLTYSGYDIHDLAVHSTFEEVICLLWNGRLPTRDEYEDFEGQLAFNMSVPPEVFALLKGFPPRAPPHGDLAYGSFGALTL
jgi:citrate synthase